MQSSAALTAARLGGRAPGVPGCSAHVTALCRGARRCYGSGISTRLNAEPHFWEFPFEKRVPKYPLTLARLFTMHWFPGAECADRPRHGRAAARRGPGRQQGGRQRDSELLPSLASGPDTRHTPRVLGRKTRVSRKQTERGEATGRGILILKCSERPDNQVKLHWILGEKKCKDT